MMKRTQRAALATALVAATVVATGVPSAVVQAADPIPDDGLPAVPVVASPLVSERTEVLAAGVIGENENNDSFENTEATVTSFAEIGNTMYVGGKFTDVEIAATGQQFNQSFLAAFDRTTGAWISSFTPTINGNVWDLRATPNGELIVAGQFTDVNGVANTAGVVMLDATSGAVHPTWRADLQLTGSTDWPIARTIDIDGDFVYIGGNFTRVTGTDGITKNAGRLARVRLSTGNADGAWLPNTDGIVFDIDADGDRVFVAGNFYNINGNFKVGQFTIDTINGNLTPGQFDFSRTSVNRVDRSYQQAILAVGNDVWLGGSEHNRQAYNRSDFSLIRSWVSNPYGDSQALAHLNGVVYSGSHAGANSLLYRDAIRWPSLQGSTGSQPIRWMSAFDTTTYEQIPWVPQIWSSNGEGSWELFADSTNCLWSGGDFDRGSFDGNVPRYVQGFAKFCATDTVPPGEPTNPTAVATGGGVNLAWTGSTGDDRGGEVRYEILKNDSVFASYISIESFRDPNGTAADRYFVRAMDYTGNRSATTRVFTGAGNDTTRPSTPTNLTGTIRADGDVDLSWTASSDNVAVTGYRIFRNGVEIGTSVTTTAIALNPLEGDNYYQVLADDAAGNESFRTPSTVVTVIGPDTTRPSTPTDLAGSEQANGSIALTWTASTDDIGVTDYQILRNGAVIDTVTATSATVTNPPAGDSYFQVRARDAAGNESFKTSPIVVTITGDDTAAPSTPTDLAATQNGTNVALTWTASTDNVGVTEYIIFRNGAEIGRSLNASFTVVNATPGDNYYQVRAIDAASNESFKTSPLLFNVAGGPDTAAPTTPTNLAGVVLGNGDIDLTWTASTDNVGVAEYVVYRNNVEVTRVTGAAATVTPSPGANFYQVRALDAAGNESFKTAPLRIDI